jgi:hypothetical protein
MNPEIEKYKRIRAAREEWFGSREGKDCAEVCRLSAEPGQESFLQLELERAWLAGFSARDRMADGEGKAKGEPC